MVERHGIGSQLRSRPYGAGRAAFARASLALVLALGPLTGAAQVRAQGVPLPPAPETSVAIGIPGSTGIVSVGDPVLVSLHVRGLRPLTGVELWANGDLVATLPVQGTDTTLAAAWRWEPRLPGDVALIALAADAQGAIVGSNALRLWVANPDGRAPDRSTATSTAGGGPRLDVGRVGCHLSLRPVGVRGATGLSVHHLSPTGATFERIATLAPTDAGSVVDMPATPGLHLFSQSSFDQRSERLGPPTAVVVPRRCGRLGWSGDARLDSGRLRVPAAVDQGYLYLQVDGGPARRVPADPAAFVTAHDRILDFGPALPRLEGQVLTFSAWGWAGSRLVDLGSGRLDMGVAREAWSRDATPLAMGVADLGLADVLGHATDTDLDLVVRQGGGEFQPVLARSGAFAYPTQPVGLPIERRLRWTTDLEGVTSIVWQVLPYSPGVSADLTPPFAIDLWSEVVAPGKATGDFVMDLSLYLEHPIAVAKAGALAGATEPVILGDPLFASGSAPAATPAPGTVSQAMQGDLGSVGVTGDVAVPVPVALSADFYVRVVPMVGATPMSPSNVVRLYLDETPWVMPPLDVPTCPTCGSNPGALQVSWTFSLPRPADPKYTACAVVTGFEPGYTKPPPGWPWTYEVGKVLCPDPPDDDGWSVLDVFEAVVSYATKVWDMVSSTYAWVKQQVIAAVLTGVPCKAIADASVCESMASIALDAVAVGFGVPPSIPDFDAVTQAMKGDLVDFIVEQAAAQFPAVALACDVASVGSAVSQDLKDCQALTAAAVDEAIEHIVASRSAAAGAATGKAYPGVIFAPDPRGQWQPPSLTFTATRTADPVQPQVCTVSGSMTSGMDDWHWPALVAGKTVTAEGDVKGSPLMPKTVALPPLAAGESVTRTMWLDRYATWFESKDSFEYWYYAKALAHPNRAWVLLQQGAKLTFTVSSNCAPTSSIGPVVLPKGATGG